ncbi:MAG: hypothetical protein ACHQFW_04650 [Chitinophagales bacterium]
MKNLTTTILALLLIPIIGMSQTNTFPTSGSAGVGTITPNASSLLEMQSTTQGMLAPRMTKTQRDAIVSPATGLLIFQTNSTPGFYYFTGAGWQPISAKGANTSLSNLVTTSINQNLNPSGDNTLDLGSPSLRWNELYVNSLKFMDGSTQSTAGGGGGTYTAGSGINITGTVISNTGDINGADDITTSSSATGDVTGLFSNLQIGSGAVGSTEIGDGTVSSTDILNGTIAATDLNSMGASSGQVLQWNGSAWVPTTPTAGTETDPQVGTISTDRVPRWDGTALINSGITDNGDNMAVGWDVTDANASGVFYNAEGIFAEEDIALKAVDHTVSAGGISTINASINLGYNTSGLFFFDTPISHAGAWASVPSTSTGNAAAVYAQNNSTATTNYATVTKAIGSGTTNIGLWAKASGATNNYAVVVPSDGGNAGFGTESPNVRLHVNALAGEDAFRVQISGTTRFLVQSGGGVSVGSLTTAPTNGLYVSGDVRIGTATPATGYKVSIDGKVMCEELKVQLSPWPDYVFANDYKLNALDELESFIKTNNHLPNIPAACEIETNGLNVGEMQGLMMEKIEELTLYVIELNKENKELQSRIEMLETK